MFASNKIDSFAISHDEKWLFAGTYKGELLTIEVDKFEVISRMQPHLGSISAVASHRCVNHICTLGLDNHISILSYDAFGNFKLLHQINIRNIKPGSDEYEPNTTTSQAINFHPVLCRIATRCGSGALLEIEYTDDDYKIIHCTRLHDDWDLITTQYTGHDVDLLSAANRGDIVLSNNGKTLKQWRLDQEVDYNTTHWLEPLSSENYIVANDCCRIIFLNLSDNQIKIGPKVALDHLEHVHFNMISKRAFASSFDRTIFEINLQTGERLKTIWHAPFKCRWIKTLKRSPSTMIVQCRNGGLYKISLSETGERTVLAIIKETPLALWSGSLYQGGFLIAGEGGYYYCYQSYGVDNKSGTAIFKKIEKSLPDSDDSYTKRLFVRGDVTVFGRTNGKIFIETSDTIQELVDLKSAIRDLVLDSLKKKLYVVCENGRLYQIDINTLEQVILIESSDPLWALSLNEEKHYLVCGTRKNRLYLLDLRTKKVEEIEMEFGFIKRMKWLDANRLLMSRGGFLVRYNILTKTQEVLCAVANTIEDFDWDQECKYLVLISYTRNIYLCDFDTGIILHEQGGTIDYMKGCLFIDKLKGASKGDFIVFGRDGFPFYHRINDERIIPFMPIF